MNHGRNLQNCHQITDHGANPFVVNIDSVTNRNTNYRTALWTGKHLQVTLMSIPVGSDIGLEMHENTDQFIRVESGCALVTMGKTSKALNEKKRINHNYAVVVPAGTWHNITNIGNTPLKLYSVYAPPKHPFGNVHKTKEDARD